MSVLIDSEPHISNDEGDCYESFETMGLKEDLLRGIYSNGLEKPIYTQQVCNQRALLTFSSKSYSFPIIREQSSQLLWEEIFSVKQEQVFQNLVADEVL